MLVYFTLSLPCIYEAIRIIVLIYQNVLFKDIKYLTILKHCVAILFVLSSIYLITIGKEKIDILSNEILLFLFIQGLIKDLQIQLIILLKKSNTPSSKMIYMNMV